MPNETYYLVTQGHSGWSADGTLPPGAVACTQAQAASPMEWTVTGGAVVAATPPAPTLAQQAQAALAAGLAVTSLSTPALDGTYPLTAEMQANLSSLEVYYGKYGTFPNKATTLTIKDMQGNSHVFTYAEFETLFKALGDYRAALIACVDGISTTLPLESDFGSIA